MKKEILSREVIFTVIATLIFAIFINDPFIDGAEFALVTRSEGLLLITLLGIFFYYLYEMMKKPKNQTDIEQVTLLPWRKSILWVILGLGALILGGERVVNGAVSIAQHFGI